MRRAPPAASPSVPRAAAVYRHGSPGEVRARYRLPGDRLCFGNYSNCAPGEGGRSRVPEPPPGPRSPPAGSRVWPSASHRAPRRRGSLWRCTSPSTQIREQLQPCNPGGSRGQRGLTACLGSGSLSPQWGRGEKPSRSGFQPNAWGWSTGITRRHPLGRDGKFICVTAPKISR